MDWIRLAELLSQQQSASLEDRVDLISRTVQSLCDWQKLSSALIVVFMLLVIAIAIDQAVEIRRLKRAVKIQQNQKIQTG